MVAAGDRLAQAGAYWALTREMTGLDEAIEALRPSYTEDEIEALVRRLKQSLLLRLLDIDGKAGPAKPLFRLKAPDEALLRPENLAPIERFVDEVAALADAVEDEDLVAVLRSLKPKAKDEELLAERSDYIFQRLGESGLGSRWLQAWNQAIEAQTAEGCYDPLVRLTEACIDRTARLLGVDRESGLRALRLFRFAVLTLPFAKQKKVYSDAAVRSLSVVVRDGEETDVLAALGEASQVLQGADPLREFHEAFENVKFTYRPAVLLVPAAVARAGRGLTAAQWLDLALIYRAGPQALARALKRMTGAESIQSADVESVALLSGPHLGKTDWKQVPVADFSMTRIRELIVAALTAQTDGAFEALEDACDGFMSHPASRNVRGFTHPR